MTDLELDEMETELNEFMEHHNACLASDIATKLITEVRRLRKENNNLLNALDASTRELSEAVNDD